MAGGSGRSSLTRRLQFAVLQLLLLSISAWAETHKHKGVHPRKHAVDETAEDDDHAPEDEDPNPWFYVRRAAVVLAASLLLLYAFLCLAITCEDYLVPCIECVCAKGKIPDEAAGALLLAFGSSAPEIMMNATATLEGQTDLSLPAVLGSAMFAFGMIPSVCVLASGAPGGLRLAAWPIVRDTLCYGGSLALLCAVLSKPHVGMGDALMLCSVYLAYIAVVLVPFLCTRQQGSYYHPGARGADGQPVLRKLSRKNSSSAADYLDMSVSSRYPSRGSSVHSAAVGGRDKDTAAGERPSGPGPLPSLVEAATASLGRDGGGGGFSASSDDGGDGALGAGGEAPAAVAVESGVGRDVEMGSGVQQQQQASRGRGLVAGGANGGSRSDAAAAPGTEASAAKAMGGKGAGAGAGASPAVVAATAAGGSGSGSKVQFEGQPTSISPKRRQSGRDRRRPKSLATYDPLASSDHRGAGSGFASPLGKGEGAGGAAAALPHEVSEEIEEPEGWVAMLGRPVVLVMDLTFPNMDGWIEEVAWWRILLAFVMSLVWVGVFSNVSLLCTSTLATELQVPNALAGATLLALGSQVPDTIASVSMSRAGMADGAISNAIGSQVINVSVGLGIPFVLYNCIKGQPVPLGEGNAGALLLGLCTLAVMIMYACAALPVGQWVRDRKISEAGLTRVGAIALLVGFSACYTVFAVRGSQIDF